MMQRWSIKVGELQEADRTFSEALRVYWTNFAKAGDPSDPSLPKWPAYDTRLKTYIEFTSTGPELKRDLRGAICGIYEEAQPPE